MFDAIKAQKLGGIKIKNLRVSREWSSTFAAEVVGMSHANILKIEKGFQGLTTFSCLSLCLAYNCTPSDLYPTFEELEAGHIHEITKNEARRMAVKAARKHYQKQKENGLF